MKLTTDHAASSYDIPVFIDDAGSAMDYAPALRQIRDNLGSERMAEIMGVSVRTIDRWVQGRMVPSKPSLMLLQIHLDNFT